MRTVVAQNVHQAMMGGCYQIMNFGTTSETGGKVLPVPSTTVIINPLERVPMHSDNPFDLLLGAARALRERRLHNVKECAEVLKNNPKAVLRLIVPKSDDPLDSVYAQIDVDGKLTLMSCSTQSDVIKDEFEMVFLSMVAEYMAAVCGRSVGILSMVSMRPECHVDALEQANRIGKVGVEPFKYSDPYTDGILNSTVPLMSIPVGRFDRELSQFFESYDTVTYIDPFIQYVLAPAHRAYELYQAGSPIPTVQRAIGEIAAQDWMQACLEFTQR